MTTLSDPLAQAFGTQPALPSLPQPQAGTIGHAAALADAIVNGAAVEAREIQALCAAVKAAPQSAQARMIHAFGAGLQQALEARGYQGAKQRASDLRAILKAAVKLASWMPDVDGRRGLQGMAKDARQAMRTGAAEQADQDQAETDNANAAKLARRLVKLAADFQAHGWQSFGDKLLGLGKAEGFLQSITSE